MTFFTEFITSTRDEGPVHLRSYSRPVNIRGWYARCCQWN